MLGRVLLKTNSNADDESVFTDVASSHPKLLEQKKVLAFILERQERKYACRDVI